MGKVDSAREVALEDGVAHVPAPHGQTLALALLEVAAAHHGPAGVAGENPPARFHLGHSATDAYGPTSEKVRRPTESASTPKARSGMPTSRTSTACASPREVRCSMSSRPTAAALLACSAAWPRDRAADVRKRNRLRHRPRSRAVSSTGRQVDSDGMGHRQWCRVVLFRSTEQSLLLRERRSVEVRASG
jgi:hypothetical protein